VTRWRHGAAVAVAGFAMCVVAGPARALNAPVLVKPKHPKRLLVTGGLVFLDSWKPLTPQLSGFFQIALCPTQVSGGNGSPQIIDAPHLYLHIGASTGYRFLQSGTSFYGLGQLGALWRTGGEGIGWLTEAGLVGALAWPERQAGPMLRIEIMDNIGLQGGPLFGWDGHGNGVLVGIDYMRDLLRDLGISGH
jgi:hypothetical protein